MRFNRNLSILIAALVAFCMVAAEGNDYRATLDDSRSLALPSYLIIDSDSAPVIITSGRAGFISSAIAGTLISFNPINGQVLSSTVVGESAGPVSITEVRGLRLATVTSVNDPDADRPATISIIDATNPSELTLHSLLVLPDGAHITTTTPAFITPDGKFCLVASSFEEPELFAYAIDTGELVGRLSLLSRPSEISIHEQGGETLIAVASATANNVSLLRLGAEGSLSFAWGFTPADGGFGEGNNPAFSSNGRTLYIGASEGDNLYSIDVSTGYLIDRVYIPSAERIAVSRAVPPVIAVARATRADDDHVGGVTVVQDQHGSLILRAEFSPPAGVRFSRANNPILNRAGDLGFIASSSGIMFAFNALSGELEAFKELGPELKRIAFGEAAGTVAVVRSASRGDELIFVRFQIEEDPPESPPAAPVISSVSPDSVEQGRNGRVRVLVRGENFGDGASLLVNSQPVQSESAKKGKALEARLNRHLFDQEGVISIQVQSAAGLVSAPAGMTVARPLDPIINRIRPDAVPGPTESFTIRVIGRNFRETSRIFVAGQELQTLSRTDREIQASVPANLLSAFVGVLNVQVRDRRVAGLVSNERPLSIFGPRIVEVRTAESRVIAGAGGFRLRIRGENFREGAGVRINGADVPVEHVNRVNGNLIRVNVPSNLNQEAGAIPVIVLNPGGSRSEPGSFQALGPVISSFQPRQIFAGDKDVTVEIRGENLRKRAVLFVGDEKGRAFKVEGDKINFHSSRRLTVTITGRLNRLISDPGSLTFQVVNPNRGDGVRSPDQSLAVVGPEIEDVLISPVTGDDSSLRVVIEGSNFRAGASIEFVSSDGRVRHRMPVRSRARKLVVVMRARKVEALGDFEVRVVNPGDVRSNGVRPRRETA